jgi:sn-glycerol 3-phosphate transport system substrate-binding protein
MSHAPSTVAPRSGRLRRASLGALAAGGLLLAACGSPPTSEGTGSGRTTPDDTTAAGPLDGVTCPLDALEEADGVIEIDAWYGGLVGVTQETLEGMATAFNESQDQVRVTANSQGQTYEEVLRKYQGASATPDQLPDVLYLEDTALGEMVDKGQVLPAEACMEAAGYDTRQITPAARAAFSVDGVLYPGYTNVSMPVLYYNKVHFERAGLDPNDPPETLEEMRTAAEAIKAAGIAETPLSFVVNRWFFETWLSGAGQTVVNNDNGRSAPPTEATFNTPEALEIVTWLKEMRDDGLLVPYTKGGIEHYLALGASPPKASMLIETSTASTNIKAFVSGDVSVEDVGGSFDPGLVDTSDLVPGVAPVPGLEGPGRAFASGGAFYILNTGSPAEQAASWKFLEFMLQPENAQTWHTNGGYLPVIKEVLDEPSVQQFWETDMAGVWLATATEQLSDADPDQAGPLIGPYPLFSQAVDGMLEAVLMGGGDPQAELDKAEAAVNEALEDYND